MKLVIDIPEEMYGHTQEYEVGGFNQENDTKLFMAIKNGKPLPEHHGDLIDRRELKKEVYTTTEWNGDVHRIIYEASIDDAKPIIEADKGVLEKINEKQDSLRATCKAWDEAIEKDEYVN